MNKKDRAALKEFFEIQAMIERVEEHMADPRLESKEVARDWIIATTKLMTEDSQVEVTAADLEFFSNACEQSAAAFMRLSWAATQAKVRMRRKSKRA